MPQNRPSRAFTLIEIMVVIAIIAILASISLVVASKVTQGGRERVTADIIKTLDTCAQAYISQAGKFPTKYTDVAGNEFLIFDGRGQANDFLQTSKAMGPDAPQSTQVNRPEPSLALFILAASKYTSVDDALKGVNPKFLLWDDKRPDDITATISESDQPPAYSPAMKMAPLRSKSDGPRANQFGIAVNDPWEQPIRFVHPAFQGGFGDGHQLQSDGSYLRVKHNNEYRVMLQINGASGTYNFRRSAKPSLQPYTTGDADEGICPGAMPYFYSSGPDKDPGTREDNVYTTKPTYPTATRAKQ